MRFLTSILDLRRGAPLIAVGAALVVALIGLNLALLATLGPAPAWLVPTNEPLAWQTVEQAESRAAGLKAQGAFNRSEACLLYLGMSSAREGIDPAVLQRESNRRTVGLCGSGSGMYRLVLMAEPFVRRKMHADLVLLCIHAVWLAGNPTPQPPSSINPVPMAMQGDWRQMLSRLRWWGWMNNNRVYVNHLAREGTYSVRRAIGAIAADDDPWRAPDRLGYPPHQSERQLARQWQGFTGSGWFDVASTARRRQAQGDALRQVIRTFCGQGTEVVVVMMPEHSRLRNAVPPETTRYLVDLVQQERCREDRAPSLEDFRDRIEDEHFSDYAHLNDDGRAEFSRILAKAVRARPISTRPVAVSE